MKKVLQLFTFCFIVLPVYYTTPVNAQGVGINTTGNPPNSSAGLDVNFTNKGLLAPRLTTAQMNAMGSPATGLVIYNTNCNVFDYYNGGGWIAMGNVGNINTPGAITGSATPCQNSAGISYSISAVTNATGYNWTVPSDATIASGQGTTSISVNFGSASGSICVAASAACGVSTSSCLSIAVFNPSLAPTANAATAITQTTFFANWTACTGSTTYYLDVSTNSSFSSYVSGFNNQPVGNVTTYAVTGLSCNTTYYYRVRAGNSCATSGNSATITVTSAACCTTNTWTAKANFGGTARLWASAFSIGTKAYIGMGQDVSNYKQDFWEWDQTTNVWTQKANFPGGISDLRVGFSIGTKGYVGTGCDGSGAKQDFWEWDQATNVWTQKANFGGAARGEAIGFSIGTKGYIGLGSDCANTIMYSDFWEWDQATNVWTQKANFGGTARRLAVGFSIGAEGYVGTGFDGANKLDFWQWDQATNIWSQKANFGGTARFAATGFSIGTKGYIGTGSDGNPKQDIWEWNQATNTWTAKTNFSGAIRTSAVGFSIGTKGYIGTGVNGNTSTYYQDFYEFCQ